jgi:hypothetical protein
MLQIPQPGEFFMNRFSDASKFALLLLALALALALPAAAQKPTIQVFPFTSFFIPGAQGCGFDVLLTPQPGRPNGERLIEFANITILQGPLFVTAKNLSTGKAINVNISGPGQAQPGIFSFPNTLMVEGPGIPGALPPNLAAAAGLPVVPVTYGRTVYTADAQGNLTSVSFTGHVDDLCQLLQ